MLHLKRNRESINKQKIYFSLLFFSFFTAILLIIIVVIGFIKKFIKLFKAITNKKGKFILLSKLSALIFIIGSCIYTIQSIKSINKRLDVIEMRFGGSSKV